MHIIIITHQISLFTSLLANSYTNSKEFFKKKKKEKLTYGIMQMQ